jgi:anion transporter
MAWVAAVVIPVVVWFAPLPVEPRAQHAIAIAAFMTIGWMAHLLDPALIGLMGCYLFWALGIVRIEDAFTGFANATTWFLFGAMLIGVIATKTGLGRRLALLLIRRVGVTYPRLLFSLILSDFLLTFLVPSAIARVVIMAAVALGLVETFGVGRGSNIGRGMFIILTYTANIFDKMIIAGASSIAARGLIETVGHVEVLWSRWALAFAPCSVLTIIAAWRLILWMYPPEQEALPGGTATVEAALRTMGPLSAGEKRAAVLMAITVALWMTDFWHHLPPPLIGLGMALVATTPAVGLLKASDLGELNMLPVLFVASALGMAHVLIETGAVALLTTVTFGWMEPLLTGTFRTTLVLYWTAFVYHLFMGDEISMLATSIPPLMGFAQAHHFDPLTIGMVWVFGAGAKILIYQSAVLVVGYSYGYFGAKDVFRVGLALSIIECVILLVLVPLYWPLLGIRY